MNQYQYNSDQIISSNIIWWIFDMFFVVQKTHSSAVHVRQRAESLLQVSFQPKKSPPWEFTGYLKFDQKQFNW